MVDIAVAELSSFDHARTFQRVDLAGYLATKRLLAMHLWTGQ